jgi:hypothetical protein
MFETISCRCSSASLRKVARSFCKKSFSLSWSAITLLSGMINIDGKCGRRVGPPVGCEREGIPLSSGSLVRHPSEFEAFAHLLELLAQFMQVLGGRF